MLVHVEAKFRQSTVLVKPVAILVWSNSYGMVKNVVKIWEFCTQFCVSMGQSSSYLAVLIKGSVECQVAEVQQDKERQFLV